MSMGSEHSRTSRTLARRLHRPRENHSLSLSSAVSGRVCSLEAGEVSAVPVRPRAFRQRIVIKTDVAL